MIRKRALPVLRAIRKLKPSAAGHSREEFDFKLKRHTHDSNLAQPMHFVLLDNDCALM